MVEDGRGFGCRGRYFEVVIEGLTPDGVWMDVEIKGADYGSLGLCGDSIVIDSSESVAQARLVVRERCGDWTIDVVS